MPPAPAKCISSVGGRSERKIESLWRSGACGRHAGGDLLLLWLAAGQPHSVLTNRGVVFHRLQTSLKELRTLPPTFALENQWRVGHAKGNKSLLGRESTGPLLLEVTIVCPFPATGNDRGLVGWLVCFCCHDVGWENRTCCVLLEHEEENLPGSQLPQGAGTAGEACVCVCGARRGGSSGGWTNTGGGDGLQRNEVEMNSVPDEPFVERGALSQCRGMLYCYFSISRVAEMLYSRRMATTLPCFSTEIKQQGPWSGCLLFVCCLFWC